MTDGVGAGDRRSVAGIIKYLLTTIDDLPTIAYHLLLASETQRPNENTAGGMEGSGWKDREGRGGGEGGESSLLVQQSR